MSHDTLSEVLRSVRLRGAVFYYVSCGEEWAAESPAAREFAPLMPGAEQVMMYHVVAKGASWAAVLGEPPVRLEEGDIVVFPHGDPHVMSSAPGLRPARPDAQWAYATRNDPKPIPVAYRGAEHISLSAPAPDAPTNLVCGFLGCDRRPFNPLIAALPRLLRIPASADGDWTTHAMMRAVGASQSRRPGAEAVLERMSETMFVDALRRYLDALPEEANGWLAGLRDRAVGRALALMHEKPADPWTIERLSEQVGLSRSALHERFVHFTDQPPMQYLAQWRMQLASQRLLQSNATVAAIALDIGYESEAAFSRAFKRIVGASPAAWRRQRVGPA
jgi:AraC-like DNA-binding protein